MSDLENLEALKRMLEHKDEEEKKNELEQEKRFIADATKAFLGKDTPVTGIQAYHPEEMMVFLDLPITEIQEKMGGEWAEMPKETFEAFAYKMRQKIHKSTSLLDWNS